MIVHNHVGRDIVALDFKMPDRGHYKGSFVEPEKRLLLGQAQVTKYTAPDIRQCGSFRQ